jgi:transitional endoplasmic reticulum ATPase
MLGVIVRLLARSPVLAGAAARASGTAALACCCVIVGLTAFGTVAAAEGMTEPWIMARAVALGFPMAAGALVASLTAFGISLGGVVGIISWVAAGIEIIAGYSALRAQDVPSPLWGHVFSLTVGALAAPAAAAVIAVWLAASPEAVAAGRRRDRPQDRQAGWALVILAGLWVAAARTGLLHAAGLAGSVDALLITPVVLACLGTALILWHGAWMGAIDVAAPVVEEIVSTGAAPSPVGRATRSPEPSAVSAVRLADVVLPESARREIEALIRILADPARAEMMGVAAPAGAILHGPPGTGKTLIARAVAGETGRPVLAYSGSELTSMWAGESAQLVRAMFEQARRSAPCVLFIDELDGLAPARSQQGHGAGSAAAQDARARLAELLQQLEGAAGPLQGVFVIGATNRLDDVDPAVRSRLGIHIEIPLPDEPARAAILRQHFPARAAATPEEIARMTDGLSGRDLRELCRAAGMIALGDRAESVTADHFARALDRIRAEPGSYATRPAEPAAIEPARLADIALPQAVRGELASLIRLIVAPDAGEALGVSAPAGAILHGPPGVGKTLIARAVAAESGRPALAFSGASLTSTWVGESTQLIRDAFRQARSRAPSVLILDELETIAPSRDAALAGGAAGADAAQRVTQLLQEIEGTGGPQRGVFIIGATNHLEAVDPAVRSRLAYHVAVPLPDTGARAAILRAHFPRQTDTSPEEIASLTEGLSGRDLRELCRIAGLVALAEGAPLVTAAHFRRALERLPGRA